MAGNKLATRILFGQITLIPTQKIKIEPTYDKLSIASGVINGAAKCANPVMIPCVIPTGKKENKAPLPIEEAMTITMIPSRILFTTMVL